MVGTESIEQKVLACFLDAWIKESANVLRCLGRSVKFPRLDKSWSLKQGRSSSVIICCDKYAVEVRDPPREFNIPKQSIHLVWLRHQGVVNASSGDV